MCLRIFPDDDDDDGDDDEEEEERFKNSYCGPELELRKNLGTRAQSDRPSIRISNSGMHEIGMGVEG